MFYGRYTILLNRVLSILFLDNVIDGMDNIIIIDF